jgi:hypothetical protein
VAVPSEVPVAPPTPVVAVCTAPEVPVAPPALVVVALVAVVPPMVVALPVVPIELELVVVAAPLVAFVLLEALSVTGPAVASSEPAGLSGSPQLTESRLRANKAKLCAVAGRCMRGRTPLG